MERRASKLKGWPETIRLH